MAFTYNLSSTVAATLLLSKVRLLIPDNDSTAYDLADDEITYFLGTVGNNVTAAAVKCCRWLARKYSKKVSFTADGLTMQHTQRAAEFAKRADELEAELSGGISIAPLLREDGYSEAAATSDYEGRAVYIKVQG